MRQFAGAEIGRDSTVCNQLYRRDYSDDLYHVDRSGLAGDGAVWCGDAITGCRFVDRVGSVRSFL